jgi:hypothetical protein
VVILIALLAVLWFTLRRERLPGRAWVLFGVYIALVIFCVARLYFRFLADNPVSDMITIEVQNSMLTSLVNDYSFTYGGFLVLVFIGLLLSRQHGRLAALLPLGFLIPAVLFGRISDDWPVVGSPDFVFFLTVSMVALLYRFLVAVVVPVWLVRSASGKRQTRAAVISLIILLAIQVGANFYLIVQYGWSVGILSFIFDFVSSQLIIGVGIALALSLYHENSIRLEQGLPDFALES